MQWEDAEANVPVDEDSDNEDETLNQVLSQWANYDHSQLLVNEGETVPWKYSENEVSVGAIYHSKIELKQTVQRWSDKCLKKEFRVQKSSPQVYDVDDLLREILLRVPARPSALPRASLVCKRWRRVVSDPRFLRRFGAHHRTASLVGYFEQRFGERDIVFSPILEPPDRIPLGTSYPWDAPHGRVALIDMSDREFTLFVCDTVTGGLARLAVPSEFEDWSVNEAVLCAASEHGHVHGACYSCPFKVVLVSMFHTDLRPIAWVYSSETGIVEEDEDGYIPKRDGILEFDLDTQSLTVMKGLPVNNGIHRRIIKTGDGGVGLVALSYPTLQIWHRKASSHHGHEIWVRRENIMGFDEVDNEIFICLDSSLFMVQLESMQFKRHSYQMNELYHNSFCHPFRSFYLAGDCSSLALYCDRKLI
ncbi:hypothetical protein BS78_K288700 [Paspalum vaginatum]|uniref:F-box domain-containing protein n=1 Tax=Paspalum vaginatum TaxID=158149 RepID=A0A9W7XDD4_9POAL|nr:hypothetical protein BS78_K288700 [Paspalum vaginatum]